MLWSPIPSLPRYTGPHEVGSSDLEIPVANLDSPAPAPAPDDDIPTVQFRVFYPCEAGGREPAVWWLNTPAVGHVQAFLRFLGMSKTMSLMTSYLPHPFYLANIPVRRNAPPLPPTTANNRWPVIVFSHGLGGNRNLYSHICGSLASYGAIVIAPDHRDHSAAVSFIKIPGSNKLKQIDYISASHDTTPEFYKLRDGQLKIRLWELGLIHNSVERMHAGTLTLDASLCENNREHGQILDVLGLFKGRLDIEPGKIVFAGHSFGAATMVQFVKSVFYNVQSDDPEYCALFTPKPESSITRQITKHTPTILLDMWASPLQKAGPTTRWLFKKPMPCYAPGGPGGDAILSIVSQTFYTWKENIDMKLACTEDPTDERGLGTQTMSPPRFFYATSSLHASQSDFILLFPLITRLGLKVEHPVRCLELNVRAMVQMLRVHGYELASTEVKGLPEYKGEGDEGDHEDAKIMTPRDRGDWRILAKDGEVKDWNFIDLSSWGVKSG